MGIWEDMVDAVTMMWDMEGEEYLISEKFNQAHQAQNETGDLEAS